MHAVHYAVGQKKFAGEMPSFSYEGFYDKFQWTPVPELSDRHVSRAALYNRAVNIVGRMKLRKTPGFPLNQVYATNLAAFESIGPEICQAAADIVWRWMTHDVSSSELPLYEDAVRLNYTECTVPFVKNEPHPLRKSQTGQWRIVNSVSLVFQIAERIILTGFIDTVKSLYGDVDPTVGIGFNEESATRFAEKLFAEIAELNVPGVLYSEDISGWDRTVTVQDVALAGRVACRNIQGKDPYSRLKQAIAIHAVYMTHPCMLIHDGSQWNLCVTEAGCMLSGSTLTTTYNSIIRAIKARATGALVTRCAGDDALTFRPIGQSIADFEAKYRTIGLTARDSKAWSNQEFSFCSHRFFTTGNGWDTYLESVPKGIFRALTRFQTFESFSGIMSELRNHPNEALYRRVLMEYAVFTPGEALGDKNITQHCSMPANANNKKKQPVSNVQPKAKTKSKRKAVGVKPAKGLADHGASLGATIGGALGRMGGNFLSRITGFGDYAVSKNTISEGNAIPSFYNDGKGVIICHREYLGDISGSTAFNNASYSINPGIAVTFPWLSTVANQFEEYEMLGLVFEYRPSSGMAVSSTSSSMGVVVYATDYNPYNPQFATKQQMESYEYSVSTVPFNSMIHAVECDPATEITRRKFVRSNGTTISTGSLPLYDIGNFQVATVGMQSAYVVGELWVSYHVRLLKPRIDLTPTFGASHWVCNPIGTYSQAAPAGTAGSGWLAKFNTVPGLVNQTLSSGLVFTLPGYYLISYSIRGRGSGTAASNASVTLPVNGAITKVDGIFPEYTVPGSSGISSGSGTSCTMHMTCIYVSYGSTSPATNGVVFNGVAGFSGVTTDAEVWVTVLPFAPL